MYENRKHVAADPFRSVCTPIKPSGSPTYTAGQHKVVAVVVTYGHRAEFVIKVVRALRLQPVARVVVVDNDADWSVAAELTASYGQFVDVVHLDQNVGSAGGFASGIAEALRLEPDFIWLLDDDNVPVQGCLDRLLARYDKEAARGVQREMLAVLAFRAEHQVNALLNVPTRYLNARFDSFCAFHVLDLPYKFWRRTPWGKPRERYRATLAIDAAPYSGLLLPRELVKCIGLPDARLVLYADDTEYAWRIRHAGGCIVLDTSAVMIDLETSKHVGGRFSSSFASWLDSDADWRAFYRMRNQAYFDRYFMRRHCVVYWLNRYLYLMVLAAYSTWSRKRFARYTLLRRAVKAGERARLGHVPGYPV